MYLWIVLAQTIRHVDIVLPLLWLLKGLSKFFLESLTQEYKSWLVLSHSIQRTQRESTLFKFYQIVDHLHPCVCRKPSRYLLAIKEPNGYCAAIWRIRRRFGRHTCSESLTKFSLLIVVLGYLFPLLFVQFSLLFLFCFCFFSFFFRMNLTFLHV